VPALATTHPDAVTAPERKPLARGAVAGLMLLSALLLCGLVGGIIGALTGALGIFLALGIFIGFVAGIAAVRARFPDL
jgi:F0F1-type ATP synthase assembly protein I